MEACHSHILRVSSSEHTGMLEHRIHLEASRVTTVEEAKHITYSDTSVEDTSSYKEVHRSL